jgi:RNA polymerase sporulation-specific sigma factor
MTLPLLLQMRRDLDCAASITSQANGQTTDTWSQVLKHQRLVFHIARRFAGYGIPSEELIQEGLIGLYHAVRTWDAGRRVTFSTWGGKLIQQAIWTYIKQQRQIIPAISLDKPAGDDREGDEQTVGDLVEDNGSDAQAQEIFHDHEVLTQLLTILPREEQMVICLLNREHRASLQEIKQRTGHDPKTIRRIEQRAMYRMRSYACRTLKMPLIDWRGD